MAIRKRGNRLVIDFYPDGRRGKRVVKSLPMGTTMEEAVAMELSLLQKFNGRNKNEEGMVSALFKKYLDFCQLHRSPKTLRDLKSAFNNHIEPILGVFIVQGLGKDKLEYYQKFRKAEGGNNRQINKELSYFGGFLSWCLDEKIIDDKPKVKSLPYERPMPLIWEHDEAMDILDALEQPYKAFCCSLYFQGLRFAEAQNLIWENVDLGTNMLKVIQKGGTWKILPINKRLRNELMEIMPEEKEGLVFRSKITGGRIIDIRKALARAKAKTKTSKHINPHLLRHSIATNALVNGANPRLLQDYLGHKNFESTQWYLHILPSHLKQVAGVIGSLGNGKLLVTTTENSKKEGNSNN